MKFFANLSLLLAITQNNFYSTLGFVTQSNAAKQAILPPPKNLVPIKMKGFMPFYHYDHDYLQHFDESIKKNVILTVSSNLPNFDSVGHNILSANYNFISYILHNEYLTHDIKKLIILDSIKLSQMGDNIGSEILQLYYNLVESCL
jgi:hypothetical protein